MIWPLNQLGFVISFSKKSSKICLWWWLFIYYLELLPAFRDIIFFWNVLKAMYILEPEEK